MPVWKCLKPPKKKWKKNEPTVSCCIECSMKSKKKTPKFAENKILHEVLQVFRQCMYHMHIVYRSSRLQQKTANAHITPNTAVAVVINQYLTTIEVVGIFHERLQTSVPPVRPPAPAGSLCREFKGFPTKLLCALPKRDAVPYPRQYKLLKNYSRAQKHTRVQRRASRTHLQQTMLQHPSSNHCAPCTAFSARGTNDILCPFRNPFLVTRLCSVRPAVSAYISLLKKTKNTTSALFLVESTSNRRLSAVLLRVPAPPVLAYHSTQGWVKLCKFTA